MSTTDKTANRKFMEMYDGFSDEIFRFVLSQTRNRDRALDITQETFIKTWDYLRNDNEIERARPFLYKTARNLIIDHSRKKSFTSLDAMLDADIPHEIADTHTEDHAEEIDRKAAIEQLKTLAPDQFEILSMRFIQELTISEIAAILNQNENAVSVRIHRALKSAQKYLKDIYE
ncbi:MAG: polymerase sigma factor, sigma-70 family [Patescibacteria group bacterium]|nr:polymerase sigma factor, sigma-70 family [Patescibacteria group bacterium]